MAADAFTFIVAVRSPPAAADGPFVATIISVFFHGFFILGRRVPGFPRVPELGLPIDDESTEMLLGIIDACILVVLLVGKRLAAVDTDVFASIAPRQTTTHHSQVVIGVIVRIGQSSSLLHFLELEFFIIELDVLRGLFALLGTSKREFRGAAVVAGPVRLGPRADDGIAEHLVIIASSRDVPDGIDKVVM